MKARLAASAALALGLVMGATGCSMVTYQATTEKYDPSDGVSANLGDIDVRNALVISEDGEDGTLVMSVVNRSDERATVTVQYGDGGDELEIDVPAGETLVLGSGDEEQVVLEGIDVEVGGLLPMYFQAGDAEGVEKQVPVLDARLPEYSELAP